MRKLMIYLLLPFFNYSSDLIPETLTSDNMHTLYWPQLHVLYSWAWRKHWHTLWASHMQPVDSGRPLCWVTLWVHHYQGDVHIQQLLWNTKCTVLTIRIHQYVSGLVCTCYKQFEYWLKIYFTNRMNFTLYLLWFQSVFYILSNQSSHLLSRNFKVSLQVNTAKLFQRNHYVLSKRP